MKKTINWHCAGIECKILKLPERQTVLKKLFYLQQIYFEWEEIGLTFCFPKKQSHSGPWDVRVCSALFRVDKSTWDQVNLEEKQNRSMKKRKLRTQQICTKARTVPSACTGAVMKGLRAALQRRAWGCWWVKGCT